MPLATVKLAKWQLPSCELAQGEWCIILKQKKSRESCGRVSGKKKEWTGSNLGVHTVILEVRKGLGGRSGSRDPSRDTMGHQVRGGGTWEVRTEGRQTES